ncbi:MAG: VIT1/CCC1 transporter family protein [Patescibacteria group bacterium]|jgi:VIT1/CCC1 family predicted Fe2+/Mn2+ transporter
MLDQKITKQIIRAQKNEITEFYLYQKLASITKNSHNQEVLKKIAQEEKEHYNFWQTQTNQKIKPHTLKLWFYFLISKFFGLTFGIKLMEKGEAKAQINYNEIGRLIPQALKISAEENQHENNLVNMIDEEKLKYVGSIVLGLNDALVELTGALAGYTLALHNTKLIAMTGLITGLAASLSMAASEYLSTSSEKTEKNPLRASIYTGITYVLVVLFLILPYLVLNNFYLALVAIILESMLIILIFTYYVSVAQDIPFKKRFITMASVSLGVAALTFLIGFIVRLFFGLEV